MDGDGYRGKDTRPHTFSLLGMERIFENISCANLGSGEDVSFPEVGIANFFFESANC
jgi:hypothetical protein